jgi:poly(3-hydroxybutyrate) depolymerase
MNLHGMSNTTIPYAGGTDNEDALPDITIYRQTWALQNGCSYADVIGSVKISTPDQHNTKAVWNCSSDTTSHSTQTSAAAIVEGFSVEGLGHAWPSTLGLDAESVPNKSLAVATFNATDYIVGFFDQHPLGF